MLVVVLIPIMIEVLQFALGIGTCDVDDVILNSLGGWLGILLYHWLAKIFVTGQITKNVVTIISIVIGLPTIALYFAATYNYLWL